MWSQNWIMSIILLLFALIDACPASESNTRQSLLQGYVDNPFEFNEPKIGRKIVYWHQRMISWPIVWIFANEPLPIV